MDYTMLVKVELVSENTKFTWRTAHVFEREELYNFVKAIKETFFEKDSPVRVSIDIAENIDNGR